ncbi:MAG: ABC transporter permease [Phycisphaerales bacterium]|nr:ABC transporter permease [Phycisphaerales bacterium]
MIGPMLSCKFHAMLRDRVATLLVFVLPILFFAIFAGIFGNFESSGPGNLTVLVVDNAKTDASKRLIDALGESGAGLKLSSTHDQPPVAWTSESARAAVADGNAPAAIIIPAKLGIDMFGGQQVEAVKVYADKSNPIAGTMIPGLLQKAAMTALHGEMIKSGLAQFEKVGGAWTARQKMAMSQLDKMFDSQAKAGKADAAKDDAGSNNAGMMLPVELVHPQDEKTKEPRSLVAFYMAGIGVMFLLFSTTGAAGSLLDDEEAGILDRVLCTPMGMGRLLVANWLWVTILGLISMIVLMVFATFVFGLGPWTWPRMVAAMVVTVFTAAAASGFGMVLASLCRSRAQLGGISTIVILVMSALGGSMIPRFLMPELVQKMGILTFNSWAVEGYLDVFWYSGVNDGLGSLLSRMSGTLAVLAGMTIAFMLAARLFARRWEHA